MNTGMKAPDSVLEGIARVSENNADWMQFALCQINRISAGEEFMGEDIQTFVLEKPKSPQAWGALTRKAVLRGLIRATGEYRKAKTNCNAHPYPVYVRTNTVLMEGC